MDKPLLPRRPLFSSKETPKPPRQKKAFNKAYNVDYGNDTPTWYAVDPHEVKPPVRNTVKMGFVAQRLPISLIARIDAYAETNGINRSEAIRRILASALTHLDVL